ncbi:hypothetical protein BYT27DRAFT_7260121 [Phlegmacium glaucopus]|nr:hypothetical protein BYT27DRAFT_7260121 [Phlegmacium glaucopus]
MSTITTSNISQRISTLDCTIQDALQLGNIANVMKQNKAELGWLFKTRRSLSNLPNAVAQAYLARVFLWPFCLAWTKAGLQANDHFITEQVQAMQAFNHLSQSLQPSEMVTEKSPLTSASGLPIQQNPALAPSALPVPQRQPKALSSALPAQPMPAKASSLALLVQPTASSLALPAQPMPAKTSSLALPVQPMASSLALPLQQALARVSTLAL